MTVKEFDSLSSRDLDNGAVLDEIREALEEHETQKKQLAAVQALFQEMKQQREEKLRVSRDDIDEMLYAIEGIRGATTLSAASFVDAGDEIAKKLKEIGIEVEE